MVFMHTEDIKILIDNEIRAFSFNMGVNYRLPSVLGVASANDPLWLRVKNIHPWIHHPKELLKNVESIIVFAVPLSLEAVESNSTGKDPSPQWLREYFLTNKLIDYLVQKTANILRIEGFESIGLKATHDYDRDNLKSHWSHRHAGYIAGLGTFGIHNLLITSKGVAVRLGTVLTSLKLNPDSKPEIEYCITKRGGKCRECVLKCPVNALDSWDTGKFKCRDWLEDNDRKYRDIIGGVCDACGKCSSGVPCSIKIPD
ncbi:MAG: epoxyqueuosine reductase [Candidatus Methanomethylicia archaeon]